MRWSLQAAVVLIATLGVEGGPKRQRDQCVEGGREHERECVHARTQTHTSHP